MNDAGASNEAATSRDDSEVDAMNVLKLRVERQTAELNAKELLLVRKQERIDELLGLLQLSKADNSPESASADTVIQLMAQVQHLSDQVRKDEDEFAMVSAALDAKESALTSALTDLEQARDRESQLRLQIQNPRRRSSAATSATKAINPSKPAVEVADACLSPRSFRESALIALRDDTIAAKTREIWLLSGQNDQLRVQLDELETALERLQTVLMHREHDAVRSQRAIDGLQIEVESLRVMRSQAEGRERAVAIAAAQNTKLLQALAVQEQQAQDLQERLDGASRENQYVRRRLEDQIQAMADSASPIDSGELISAQRKELAALHDKLQRERKREQAETTELRMKHQLAIDRLESELVMRRTRQYELTRELQEAQGDLHDAIDARDTAVEQLAACQGRMHELEGLLNESLARIAILEGQLSDSLAQKTQSESQAQKRQTSTDKEVGVLRKQLEEINASLLAAVKREKLREREILDRAEISSRLESTIREQRERIARLAEQVTTESQQRAELALENQVVMDQLHEVKRQFANALSDWSQHKQQLESKELQTREQVHDLQRELSQSLDGKSVLIRRISDAIRAGSKCDPASKTTTSTLLSEKPLVLSTLALDGCILLDRDMGPLLTALLAVLPSSLKTLDLRGNHLTSESARAIASFLQQVVIAKRRSGGETLGLVELDLRQNFIALDGVREIANTLEILTAGPANSSGTGNSSSWLSSVVVANDGRIECLSDSRRAVLVIDVTANLDPEAMMTEVKKYQIVKRQRQCSEDTFRAPPKLSNNFMSLSASALQEIYGADLVRPVFGVSPTVKVTARRKPNPMGPLAPTASSPRSHAEFPIVDAGQLPAVQSSPREEEEESIPTRGLTVSTPVLPKLGGK